MTNVLMQVALFVRDLLSYDEALIQIGRSNYKQANQTQNLIVVDDLGSRRIARGRVYDKDSETMTDSVTYQSDVTIDFFGQDALTNLQTFELALVSENAMQLQSTLGITVFHPNQQTNVRQLTGSQYGPDYQIALQVRYNVERETSVNAITDAVTSLITN